MLNKTKIYFNSKNRKSSLSRTPVQGDYVKSKRKIISLFVRKEETALALHTTEANAKVIDAALSTGVY
jgi:hypothetical protein